MLFPNATNMVVEFANSQDWKGFGVLSEKQEQQAEINATRTIKYLCDMAPNVNSVSVEGLSFEGGSDIFLDMFTKLGREVLSMAKRRLEIKCASCPYEAYFGTLDNFGGIVDLNIAVASFANIWLIQRCSLSLQRLCLDGGSVSIDHLSSIIVDGNGEYAVYPPSICAKI